MKILAGDETAGKHQKFKFKLSKLNRAEGTVNILRRKVCKVEDKNKKYHYSKNGGMLMKQVRFNGPMATVRDYEKTKKSVLIYLFFFCFEEFRPGFVIVTGLPKNRVKGYMLVKSILAHTVMY